MSTFFNYHIKGRVKMLLERRQLNASTEEPVLVFTMAKVGSSSIYNSIKHTTNIPAFHIHSLDLAELQSTNQRCFDQGLYPDSRSPVPFIQRDIIYRRRPFKVISLFRNPIDRNLSAFFDAFRLMMGVRATAYKGGLDELADAFRNKVNHDYPIEWYQRHFLPGVGLNVYKHDFNKDKGYSIIRDGHCSVLLMDSALDDAEKESVISNFLNQSSFELQNANVRANSQEAELYEEFKSYIRLDEPYVNRMLNSAYFEHFFSHEDKEKTKEKWLGK